MPGQIGRTTELDDVPDDLDPLGGGINVINTDRLAGEARDLGTLPALSACATRWAPALQPRKRMVSVAYWPL